MKVLLFVTALVEAGTGIGLAIAPSAIVRILLGSELDSPASLVMARVLGAALIAVAAVCWFARYDLTSRVVTALVGSLLFYNIAAILLLGYAHLGLRMVGMALVPAMILHLALAVSCVVQLRATRTRAA